MQAYYLDTSALIKRYAREEGTAWMTTLTDPVQAHDLYTVRLTGPEMIAALFRKTRTGQYHTRICCKLPQMRVFARITPTGMVESALVERACWIVIQHKRYRR